MNKPYANRLASLAAAAALVFAAGCHKKVAPPPPPPPPPAATAPAPTASISVNPSSINSGGSAVLSWKTENATTVTISGIGNVNTYGTQTVSPTESTTYTLTAEGDGGSTNATARLTVAAAPVAQSAPENITEQVFEENVKPAFFDFDSYSIRADAQSILSADAAYLNAHPNLKIVVGGYCDDRGSVEYNLALGENRANAAKQALIADGVSADRMRTVSYGKEKQFCTEQNEQCWQSNRRANFTLDQ